MLKAALGAERLWSVECWGTGGALQAATVWEVAQGVGVVCAAAAGSSSVLPLPRCA